MAQNHVSRYTLAIFHTFALLRNSRENEARAAPKVMFFAPKVRQGRHGPDLFYLFGPIEKS